MSLCSLFTFEVVPCLILGLFRRFFHRYASILAQHYKGVGGRRVGVGGGEGGGKTPRLTWGHQSPSDGPDHSTRPKGHHSSQGQNFRLVTPNWRAPQVLMWQSWLYKVVNLKADQLSLAMGDMLCK